MSTHYILVTVHTADDVTDKSIIDEILSDLGSCEGDLSIQADSTAVVLPHFAEDLQTLHASTQDATDQIECVAALANFADWLMKAANVQEIEVDECGKTNLDRFNLIQPASNPLNGLRFYRNKDTGAVYIPLPKAQWGQGPWTESGACTCGKCDGSGKWDTLVIPGSNDRQPTTFTVHLPELQTGKPPSWLK